MFARRSVRQIYPHHPISTSFDTMGFAGSSGLFAMKSRLIVVSNRLPVSVVHEGTTWGTKRSAGGLATAMDPILKDNQGLWIGWSGTQDPLPPEVLKELREEQSCSTVDLPPDLFKKYYD